MDAENSNSELPPLPPSDNVSLNRNHFSGFYQIGARDFWDNNEINGMEVKEFQKCEHFFIQKSDSVICKNCNAGWMGASLEAKNGKLYVNGETFEIK